MRDPRRQSVSPVANDSIRSARCWSVQIERLSGDGAKVGLIEQALIAGAFGLVATRLARRDKGQLTALTPQLTELLGQ